VRSLLAWTLVAGALVLAAAGSAAAFSQPRAGSSARSVTGAQSPVLFYVATTQTKSSRTCQATKAHQTAKQGKFEPIACEQAPKPNVNLGAGSTLSKAAAIDALG
jgi:hypothetical protein